MIVRGWTGFSWTCTLAGMRQRPRRWVGVVAVAGALFACESAEMPLLPGVVDSGGEAPACGEAAAVRLSVSMRPSITASGCPVRADIRK